MQSRELGVLGICGQKVLDRRTVSLDHAMYGGHRARAAYAVRGSTYECILAHRTHIASDAY